MTPPATARQLAPALARLCLAVLPVLALAVALLVAVQPRSGPAVSTAALVPVVVLVFWALQHPGSLSILAVFAAGLVLDCVSGGPLGFWALLYVAGFELARVLEPFARRGRWHYAAALLAVLSCTVLLQGLIVALTHREWPNFKEGVIAALGAALLYPVVAVILEALGALAALTKVEPS